MIARVGGISRAIPKMSVMNPGVRRSAPPRMIIAPLKISFAGIRPSARARLKRSHATRLCERASAAPTMLSTIRSASVGQDADRAADLDDHPELRDREHDEGKEKERQHAAPDPTSAVLET